LGQNPAQLQEQQQQQQTEPEVIGVADRDWNYESVFESSDSDWEDEGSAFSSERRPVQPPRRRSSLLSEELETTSIVDTSSSSPHTSSSSNNHTSINSGKTNSPSSSPSSSSKKKRKTKKSQKKSTALPTPPAPSSKLLSKLITPKLPPTTTQTTPLTAHGTIHLTKPLPIPYPPGHTQYSCLPRLIRIQLRYIPPHKQTPAVPGGTVHRDPIPGTGGIRVVPLPGRRDLGRAWACFDCGHTNHAIEPRCGWCGVVTRRKNCEGRCCWERAVDDTAGVVGFEFAEEMGTEILFR